VLRSRVARIEDLRAALAATPARTGNRERRRLLLQSRAEPWSMAERLAHRILHQAGITGWLANRPVVLGGRTYFLDIAFPGIRLVLEIDGREFHAKADVFESDRRRQNDLVLARFTVLRFTYRRLVEEPDQVLAEVRAGIELARLRRQLEGF
jgi:very-short-patch-repair endonuclease